MDRIRIEQPATLTQILVVVLLWLFFNAAVMEVFDSPLVRWEFILGSLLVLVWALWSINNRLQQLEQDRYKQKR